MGAITLGYTGEKSGKLEVENRANGGAIAVEDIDRVFEDFVVQYGDKIFNLIYWKVGNYDDAKDLTSEVLFKVYSNLPKFRGKSSLYTWAYRIALNHTNRFLLKRKVARFVSFDELKRHPVEPSNEYQEIERNELREKVRRAILELPSKYRDIVVLRYLENRSYEEIAEILDVPSGTVKSRLNRARERLARKLKGVVEI